MSVAVGSQTVIDDSLFSDYTPSLAFLFPGQVSYLNINSLVHIVLDQFGYDLKRLN